MAVIGRGSISSLLVPDARKLYIEVGEERPLEFEAVFNVDTMPWNSVKDLQMSGLGTMPAKAEGAQFTLDQPIMGGTATYLANPYGIAVEFTYEGWRDELYGAFQETYREMARASRNRQEVDAFAVLNDAFTGNTYTGFDGVRLCSTAHDPAFAVAGASVSNRANPDIGFSQTGLQNAIVRFHGLTDPRGLPRLMSPTNVLVTQQNLFLAREILGSGGKPYTADNELNALIAEEFTYTVLHYITTLTNWWVTAPKGVHDLNFFWRDRPLPNNFDDPWTGNAVFTLYQRHVAGFGAWRGVDGSTG